MLFVPEYISISGIISKYYLLGTDLALLTLADHSILSYGTFGMWGALLANGGEVALPTGYDTHRINKEINWAKTLGLLKNWIFIWLLPLQEHNLLSLNLVYFQMKCNWLKYNESIIRCYVVIIKKLNISIIQKPTRLHHSNTSQLNMYVICFMN